MKTIPDVRNYYENNSPSKFLKNLTFFSIFYWKVNPFGLCKMQGNSQNQCIFQKKFLENSQRKIYINYSIHKRVCNEVSDDTKVDRICISDFPRINI